MNTTWNDSRFGPGSYEHASQEDRCAARVPVHIAASLRPSGARAFATIVRDLSLGGFTATAATRLEAHSVCWLTIPGFGALQAEVIWWEAGLAGAAFSRMISLETFEAMVAHYRGNGPEPALD
jgi:hypothetical protein